MLRVSLPVAAEVAEVAEPATAVTPRRGWASGLLVTWSYTLAYAAAFSKPWAN